MDERRDPFYYCDLVAREGFDGKRINSSLVCVQCKEIGAEYHLPAKPDMTFCHEDCARAHLKLPSYAKDHYGDESMLVGYELQSGRAGVCTACLTQPITHSYDTEVKGLTVGICNADACASEIDGMLRGLQTTEQVRGLIRRLRLHKSYRKRDVVAAALMLYGAGRDRYAQNMAEVFALLAVF